MISTATRGTALWLHPGDQQEPGAFHQLKAGVWQPQLYVIGAACEHFPMRSSFPFLSFPFLPFLPFVPFVPFLSSPTCLTPPYLPPQLALVRVLLLPFCVGRELLSFLLWSGRSTAAAANILRQPIAQRLELVAVNIWRKIRLRLELHHTSGRVDNKHPDRPAGHRFLKGVAHVVNNDLDLRV
eukprot:COSAG02_NODE_5580_length_4215_cov_2.083576_4_plen_183_part_00